MVSLTLTALISLIPFAVATSPYHSICKDIKNAISDASDVYWPGHYLYTKDTSHWATSSSQFAACSVEPGSAEDIGKILNILSANQTPFAVKGGGHASNPGFSSTEGVQIAMYRFSEVTYDESSSTATIGAGLVWDDVYAGLADHGVNIVGGRVTGVGVAGFTLGGGYSWKSNQYGLTVDTVTAYELVKPSGEVVTVTADSDSELFFGLKGGFNNFGIVTRFTLQTHPQTDVWGGLLTYTFNAIPAANNATVAFSNNVKDPKAQIITTYNFLLGQPGISQLLFYDGPEPPAGIFDDFLNIPYFTKDIKTRPFADLVKASPSNATSGQRGSFQSVPLTAYTPKVIEAIANESKFWGENLALKSGSFISYDVEPFLQSAWLSEKTSSAAYPPDSSRSSAYLPLNLYYAWDLEVFDDDIKNALLASAAQIRAVAADEGQRNIADAPIYPNYALGDTPLEQMYAENVDRLKTLKQRVDPTGIMNLAGGFKF